MVMLKFVIRNFVSCIFLKYMRMRVSTFECQINGGAK